MTVEDKTDQPSEPATKPADAVEPSSGVEPAGGGEPDQAAFDVDEPTTAAQTAHGDTAATDEAKPVGGKRGDTRWLHRAKLVPTVLIVLLLISAGLTTWSYFGLYRPDKRTGPNVAREVVSAASDGTVALLSYSPDSVDKDLATAKSHLTGDFLSYYDQFTQQIVAPAAKEKEVHTTAEVTAAAVSELHPDSAVVLVFVDQNTTSKDRPDPSMSASSVQVTLTKVGGAWLISKFDPV